MEDIHNKTLIIYDSFFGNTEKIARAIGQIMKNQKDTSISCTSDFKPELLEGVELLIVGSPTRAFSPSTAIKAFVKNIPAKSLGGVKVAAFDTRMDINAKMPAILRFLAGIFGYASQPILNGLVRKGGEQVSPSAGFIVTGTEGPLAEGELERAAEWAKKISNN